MARSGMRERQDGDYRPEILTEPGEDDQSSSDRFGLLRDAARIAGRHAGLSGLPVKTCPYDAANDADPVDRALARTWVGAFLAAAPDVHRLIDVGDTTVG